MSVDILQELDRLKEMFDSLESEKPGTLVSICYRTPEGDDVAVGNLESSDSAVGLKVKASYVEIPRKDVLYYTVVK
ncbi:Uncharacterised protein [uncultured archaeon]|nr:Uncharacterised protein [uncultured archaeon]